MVVVTRTRSRSNTILLWTHLASTADDETRSSAASWRIVVSMMQNLDMALRWAVANRNQFLLRSIWCSGRTREQPHKHLSIESKDRPELSNFRHLQIRTQSCKKNQTDLHTSAGWQLLATFTGEKKGRGLADSRPCMIEANTASQGNKSVVQMAGSALGSANSSPFPNTHGASHQVAR